MGKNGNIGFERQIKLDNNGTEEIVSSKNGK